MYQMQIIENKKFGHIISIKNVKMEIFFLNFGIYKSIVKMEKQ